MAFYSAQLRAIQRRAIEIDKNKDFADRSELQWSPTASITSLSVFLSAGY